MLFRTAIFESFEPESDEEEEEENASEDEGNSDAQDQETIQKMKELALKDFPDDESDGAQEDEDDEQLETGVQTSQLRHFVIQASQIANSKWYDGVLMACAIHKTFARSMYLDPCLLTH